MLLTAGAVALHFHPNTLAAAKIDGAGLKTWLEQHRTIGAKDLEPTSWEFARLKTHGPVVFKGASDKQALAHEAGLNDIKELKNHGEGTATYEIDLSH